MPPSDICDCPQVVLSDPQTTRLHVYHSGRTHNLRIFVLYLRGVHNLVETCAFNSSITQPRRKIPMIGCQSTPDTQAQQMSFAAHDTCLGYRLLINFEAISLLAEFRFYQYQNSLFLWSVISNKQPKPSFKQRYDVVRLVSNERLLLYQNGAKDQLLGPTTIFSCALSSASFTPLGPFQAYHQILPLMGPKVTARRRTIETKLLISSVQLKHTAK